MDSQAQLETIDRATVTGPVRRALHRDTLEVLNWQSSRLGGGAGNPVSLGLYRLSGTGHDGGETLPWSLVLKMAQSPANVGAVDMGEGEDQRHWNYWQREMHVYQSGLLDSLPQGLAGPRCFGIEQRAGDVIWLWLEEVTDVYDGAWPLSRFELAAQHFGRFNGTYLAGRPLPAFPWLSIGIARQWCADLKRDYPHFGGLDRQPSMWQHPLVRRIYPHPDVNPFLHLLLERERFLAALEQLPRTLNHNDAYPTNLVASRDASGGEVTVAIDWALAGVGPVGQELAQLAVGAADHVRTVTARHASQAVFEGYLDGLREGGWHGDVRAVRFGYVASAALRIGLWLLWLLDRAFAGDGATAPGETPREPVEAVIEQLARPTRFVLDLAEEAYELLDRMA